MLQAGRSQVWVPMSWIFFSNDLNPSSRTMALALTQPVKEMSTRNLPGGVKGGWCVKAHNLTAIYEQIVYIMRDPQHLTTPWASMACYRDSFSEVFPITAPPHSSAPTIPISAYDSF
jgi:hypothetical protein